MCDVRARFSCVLRIVHACRIYSQALITRTYAHNFIVFAHVYVCGMVKCVMCAFGCIAYNFALCSVGVGVVVVYAHCRASK